MSRPPKVTFPLTLTIPAPGPFLNANDRTHWRPRAKLVSEWRTVAALVARTAGYDVIDRKVRVVATVHRSHNRGRWDATNLAPTGKACVDGLVDAGLLRDDANRYLIGPDMRAGEPRAHACLVLTIEPTKEKP